MNDRTLQPDNPNEFFQIVHTRPSPLPQKGLELGALEVCYLRAPQGELYPAAESYYFSLIWALSGQFSLYVDDIRHIVRSGELLLLEPGGELRATADEADNLGYYLLLDGSQTKGLLNKCGLWSGVFPYIKQPRSWLEQISNEIQHLPKQEQLASIGHSLILSAAQDAKKKAPDKIVWEACLYLQQNWDHPKMNVEMVLKHLNISRSTLSPRFRKMTGSSILDYLMDIRYRKALKMLRDYHAPIAEIAKRCGFQDASWFSTWFRKRNGASPRAKRAQQQTTAAY